MNTPEFTSIQHRTVGDWNFCTRNPAEFQSNGRFSTTKALRTVASMNDDITRKQFIEILSWIGLNANTVAKQFAQSRAFDVKMYGKTLNADGTLSR